MTLHHFLRHWVTLTTLGAAFSMTSCILHSTRNDSASTAPNPRAAHAPKLAEVQTAKGQASASGTKEESGFQLTAASATPSHPPAKVEPVQNPRQDEPPVASNWQEKMLHELTSSSWNDAWGLFSEGGWSDAGQIMILANATQTRLLVVEPGQKTYAVDRALTKDEQEQIVPLLRKSTGLANINEKVFDGVVFEIVHAIGGAQPKVVERLFVRASGAKPYPAHDAIIEALQKLRPKS